MRSGTGGSARPSVGNAQVDMVATRASTEEDFAQRQLQHLVEKGVHAREGDV